MWRKGLKILAIGVLGIAVLLAGVSIFTFFNQEEILSRLRTQIGQKVQGTVHIQEFHFTPFHDGIGLTFSLESVSLSDSASGNAHPVLFKANTVSVTLSPWALLTGDLLVKRISLKNGYGHVFIDSTGRSNLVLLGNSEKDDKTRKKAPEAAPEETHNALGGLRKLSLEAFRVTYEDSSELKFFGGEFNNVEVRLGFRRTLAEFSLNGLVNFDSLVFNQARGGYLANRRTEMSLKAKYSRKEDLLAFTDGYLKIEDGSEIAFSGEIDVLSKERRVRLHFETEQISVPEAAKLLPYKLEQKIKRTRVKPVIAAKADLEGYMKQGRPRLEMTFKTEPFEFELPIGFLRKMTCSGRFTNQFDRSMAISDSNTKLYSNDVKGFFETIPVSGSIMVSRLHQPDAVIKAKGRIDSSSVNALLDADKYKVNGGVGGVDFNYRGNLKALYDKKSKLMNGQMFGMVTLKNMSLLYKPQAITLSRINAVVEYDRDQIRIKNLSVFDQINHLNIKGKLDNLFGSLLGAPKPCHASVDVSIDKWQLNWMGLLVNRKSVKGSVRKGGYRITRMVDRAIDRMNITASLNVNEMHYNRFEASKVKGQITLTKDTASLNGISMNAFGGSISASGLIDRGSDSTQLSFLNVKGKVTNAEVASVLHSFNNFGQKTITEKNLSGILDADFLFAANLTSNLSIVPASMDGKLNFHLANGNVRNFEPFMKMKKIAFKNREFQNVRFAPIRNNFVLKGQEIIIDKMEIESNVLTLFLEGTYSFGQKTDLSVQLPLRNLKKRDSTYTLTTTDPGASSIFLRAIDEKGVVNIRLDAKKTIFRGRSRKSGRN